MLISQLATEAQKVMAVRHWFNDCARVSTVLGWLRFHKGEINEQMLEDVYLGPSGPREGSH